MKNKQDKQINSKIGGQAVLEGVMMRGENSIALAVRDPKGEIRVSVKRPKSSAATKKIRKIPLLRGIWSFGASMTQGTKTLLDSAEVFGEEEPSKFENWLSKKFKIDLMNVVITISLILGLALSIALFILIPSYGSKWIADATNMTSLGRSGVEGGIRLVVFIAYIVLTALVPDVKRVYMYHGAEHKTLNCFEKGLDMTVENTKTCKRFHNRCGTSFMFFVILLSILVFSFLDFEGNELLRIVSRIAFLPILAGLSYEMILFLAKHDWKILYLLRVPGILMQKITTKNPDDKMLEVALVAFNEAARFDADLSLDEYDNLTFKYFSQIKEKYLPRLEKIQGEECELYFMVCHLQNIKRSEIGPETKITKKEQDQIALYIIEREKRIPLWYILGKTNFYGFDFAVSPKVLIPRPETEQLIEQILAKISKMEETEENEENQSTEKVDVIKVENFKSCLEIGTGSGAIAVTLALKTDMEITASDISHEALEIAKENAKNNSADVNFILSDVYENINGKFDIIISNPPYIDIEEKSSLSPEVLTEPHIALFAENHGLAIYEKIVENAENHLNKNGLLFFEIGHTQGDEIKNILYKHGFVATVLKDYAQLDRIVIGEKNV